jgi:hypothetical protein
VIEFVMYNSVHLMCTVIKYKFWPPQLESGPFLSAPFSLVDSWTVRIHSQWLGVNVNY